MNAIAPAARASWRAIEARRRSVSGCVPCSGREREPDRGVQVDVNVFDGDTGAEHRDDVLGDAGRERAAHRRQHRDELVRFQAADDAPPGSTPTSRCAVRAQHLVADLVAERGGATSEKRSSAEHHVTQSCWSTPATGGIDTRMRSSTSRRFGSPVSAS